MGEILEWGKRSWKCLNMTVFMEDTIFNLEVIERTVGLEKRQGHVKENQEQFYKYIKEFHVYPQ